MNERLKGVIRGAAQHPIPGRIMGGMMNLFLQCNPGLRSVINRAHFQYFQFPLVVNKNIADLLDQVPSETSPQERRFLYRFFSTIWSGKNDVIEIGPFLGGTTRAIALGMCDNPNVSDNSRLHTYDRFYGYYDLHSLTDYLTPLLKAGILYQSDLDSLGESVEFMDIFERIHANHEYYHRIVASSQLLPGKREDLQDGKANFQVNENTLTDAVFIDGCKSWFGTKYFMSEVSKAARIGTYFIFQDYAWYSCFWLPAFLELLKDYFRLIGYVATTYVFILTKPLDEEAINKHYPDKPSDLGENRIVELFDCLINEALSRNDYFAFVRHSLQSAGALAYIGNKEKAKEIITALKRKPSAAGHEKIIDAALESPTYSPDERITL